nr:nucleotide-binding alpha-beta plait domain-containing protein [Tanacetum cinerariifolium]
MQPKNKESEATPVLVLSDECLLSKDLSKSLFGRVKQFASPANIRKTVSNEGFADIKIQYMGELWVLLEFVLEDSIKLFQDNIRAKKAPGWVLDFMEENDDEEQNDDGGFNVHKLGFTPKEGTDVVDRHAEESKSNNIVNLGDYNAEEVNNTFNGNVLKEFKERCFKFDVLRLLPNINGPSYMWINSEFDGRTGEGRASHRIQDGGVFFYHWIEMEGFSKVLEDAWREGPCDESNAMINMMIKLKYLKTKILEWNKKNMLSAKNIKAKYKDELGALEAIIDKGDGNVEVVNKRMEVVNTLQKIDKICSSEMAQKAKVELESDVSNEEIKRTVWDCGIDKSPGPDGFTF